LSGPKPRDGTIGNTAPSPGSRLCGIVPTNKPGKVVKAGLQNFNSRRISSLLWGKHSCCTPITEQRVGDIGEHLELHTLACWIKAGKINGRHLLQPHTTCWNRVTVLV
jgi:hypothetical protein